MSVYQLKTAFQNKLRPISNTLIKQGFTANQITLSAVILSLITAHLIARHAKHHKAYWYLLPTGLFVRMAMNAIDGMMAKEHGQASTLGAWLNESGDMVSDTALFLGLLPHTNHPAHLVFITALSLATELTAIMATLLTGERANHGPLGKSDRALALGIFGLIKGLDKELSYERLILVIAQLLLIKTIINRGQAIICHRSTNQQ
ncbi:CDP-alcohol phosphatidyltransferase family protein [Moraxella bovis]|uniref:CDP-alcohol phosphatidyltransferase family protein n=1 Tax=Moraxella bovis TaxID=476 RepID=A0AAX3ER02_MORBO|nr:CDP-alcohol phosphatidyltransferase family protein [Moraxella bovis]AWY20364.1 CDP-alcohol phosphatidyltransferase family protein [Moraxella bovis]UYZ74458.1 CDP-alcohol phosphatidyltransferase family protein [Moraxella bovis]UYZ82395.1 CDP-alcohol phosphatidyltransferase family protein [Moraxella bovis]UYZ93502.1 CDP-alcohol phosphatidyltransferase family protein [Moraxella bovis]UZA04580.1 CDP-alcohol phosphatidyltransferase family protein [Moraxella bovis]